MPSQDHAYVIVPLLVFEVNPDTIDPVAQSHEEVLEITEVCSVAPEIYPILQEEEEEDPPGE
jgi:hypothetical protein